MKSVRQSIRWVMIFRIAFLSVMLVSSWIAHRVYAQDFSIELLSWIIGGAVFTVISYGFLRVWPRFARTNAWAQILWDMTFASFVVLGTGSLYSGFVLIYALYVLTAAVMLMTRGAVVSTFLAVGGFLGVCFWGGDFEGMDLHSFSRLLFVSSNLLILGGVVAYMVRNKERLQSSLHQTSSDLKDLSARYQAIIENIPSGILYLDKDGICLYANAASREILDEDFSGYPVSGSFLEPLLEAKDRAESDVILSSGTTLRLGHHRTILSNGDQVLLFQDLTKIRRLEREVVVKDKMATVGQLAAGMAHEIRNPLASLSGSIQVLKNESEAGGASEKLMNIVLRETDRLDHLVNDFLNYARPSVLKLRRFKLHDCLEEILESYKNSKRRQEREVQLQLEGPRDLEVEWDYDKLCQILTNLLDNAIDASKPGGMVRLSFEERGEANSVRLMVVDQGRGMDERVRQRIFDPFYTNKEGGVGLGLALVYEMIRAHQGEVSVESQEDQGTVFFLEFPREGIRVVDAA